MAAYTGSLFSSNAKKTVAVEEKPQQQVVSVMVQMQMDQLVQRYGTQCFNVQQLSEILGIGRSTTYKLLKSGKVQVAEAGGRKIVCAVALATYMIYGHC